MICHVIWDFDGTLFNTYPAICRTFRTALNDLGGDAELEWIEQLAREAEDQAVPILAAETGSTPEALSDRLLYHYRSVSPSDQPPFPGGLEVCRYIEDIGGTNVIVTHRDRESATALLAAYAAADLFTDLLTRDDGFPRKPDPASFEAMIERHDLGRDQTLAVGDRRLDVLAGKAAGVRTCLFGDRVTEINPDYAITDYDELHQLIRDENDLVADG